MSKPEIDQSGIQRESDHCIRHFICPIIIHKKTPILELRHFMRVGMNAIELMSPKVNKTGDIQKITGSGLTKANFGEVAGFPMSKSEMDQSGIPRESYWSIRHFLCPMITHQKTPILELIHFMTVVMYAI